MGFEGYNCTFSCDLGCMLQGNTTSGTCENTGNWSEVLSFSGSGSEELLFSGNWTLPSCVPLIINCSKDGLPVPANATVLQFIHTPKQSIIHVDCSIKVYRLVHIW